VSGLTEGDTMVPLKVLTLIFTGPVRPSILVLEPIEEHSQEDTTRVIPIWIGANEAVQLGAAIENIKMPRPMTHDLFINAITNLDARIDHVLINNSDGETFFSQLYLKQGNRIVQLDARPTDALSLAIREDVPFFIEETVLQHSSFPYIYKNKAAKEAELTDFHSFIQNVSPEDFNMT
jgi:bifunctional DNase/RNase